MTHDPLCPRSDSRNGQHCEDCGPWCQCHLIAKVRKDEVRKAARIAVLAAEDHVHVCADNNCWCANSLSRSELS